MCEKCLKSHNEELSSHRIISIYHSNECDHHQIVSFFCPSHGQELCVTCRIQHHTKCHNVFPINKYKASIILITTIPAAPNGDITSDVVTNVKNGMDCHIRHVLNESLDIISDNYGSQTSLSEEHQRPTKNSKDLRNNKSKQEKKHESIEQTATETLRLKFLSMKEKHWILLSCSIINVSRI